MAMGPQRAIHPFFQKDHGIPAQPPPNDLTNDGTSVNSVSNDSLSCQTSLATHTPPPAVLDHDPNSSRRKRRRIKDTIDSSLIENYLEDDTPEDTALPVQIPSTGPHTPSVGSDQIEEIHQSDLRLTVGESRGPDQSSNSGTLNDISERSTKPKTLKLNPNGKLLSSPSSSGVEDNPQKTRGRPRGSNRRANEERKPLVLKYAKDDGNREQIGKLIDDIISGQRRLGATECPAAPADRGSQPLKPTHPFFLKKPPRKADMADPIPQVGQDTAVGLSEVGKETPPPIQDKPNLDSSAVSRKAFFSFKQRPKFPEPINPLWPPRDLFHVRGFSTDSHQQSGTGCDVDEKKAKTAAIRISAQENILLSTINEAQRPHEVKTLRVPERYVGSGRILQKAVAKQLSNASIGGIAGDKNPSKPCHPAIKKLSSSIPTSMAAFDRGEFENSLWAHKYMPSSAEEVLQTSREPLVLRDWLKDLMVSAVDTGKPSKDPAKAKWKEGKKKRSKRRKMTQELEGFVDSSENEQSEMDALSDSDEDELAGDVTVSSKRTIIRPGDMAVATRAGGERCRLSNAILLSGPSGCGKTASVYAVAKELGFEVFEINPGSRRTSRDVLERVGNMTRNHLVRNLNAQDQFAGQASQASASEESKKNKMKSFFKPTPAKEPGLKGAEQESDPKPTRNQKQSLILLEEADLLFDEDKPFWSGVMTLISQSKRPIIITCNDESLIPLEDISLHAILRYRAPPQDLAVDYILLLAANEGHMLRRDAVNDLHAVYGRDIRKTITDLSFWCQMAIGSEKSGLDWVIDRWPPRSDLDQHGDPLRVISLNAYQRFMGWFGRDMIGNGLHGEAELSQESLDWWRLSIQDSENMTDWHRFRNSASTAESFVAKPSNERLNGLRQTSDYVDMKSDLDMLCSSCAIDPKKDVIDISTPPISEKQRASYIEGYPLLQADLESDHTLLSMSIGSTFEVLMRQASRTASQLDAESSQAMRVLANASQPNAMSSSAADALSAFEPIVQANYVFPLPTGRLAPSFENGSGPLFQDLAPYIRAIVAFDLRLEKYRLQLSGLLSQDTTGAKRVRTTRASRAALEGGNKSHTRKERWFPREMSPNRVLATGNQAWQDLLIQRGYFALGPVAEQTIEDQNSSESSGDGGI